MVCHGTYLPPGEAKPLLESGMREVREPARPVITHPAVT
jgi:hypothetical protein